MGRHDYGTARAGGEIKVCGVTRHNGRRWCQ